MKDAESNVESCFEPSSSSQKPLDQTESLLQHPQQNNDNNKKRKNTRKPSFRPAFIPSLRIMKRDIRRKYPEMLQNVVNLHDISLLQQFLEEFSVPHLVILDANASLLTNERFHWPIYTSGFLNLLEAMKLRFSVFPDSIYTFQDTQIFVSLNERGSRVIGTLKCHRTQVFDVHFFADDVKGKSYSSNNSSMDGVNVDGQPSYRLVRAEKERINELEGTILLQLDESHRIETVRMIFQHLSLK